jgi:hypothetical protein
LLSEQAPDQENLCSRLIQKRLYPDYITYDLSEYIGGTVIAADTAKIAVMKCCDCLL